MRGPIRHVGPWVIGLCGCSPAPDLPPPPIQSGATAGPVRPVGGGLTESPPSDSTATTGGGSSRGETSVGSDTGLGMPLLSGQLLEGTTERPPATCELRLHRLEAFDPISGRPLEPAYTASTVIQAFPQPYIIFPIPEGTFVPGDDLYVSTQCDIDGDGALDDVGGYYPGLPAEPITVPAVNIDLVLERQPPAAIATGSGSPSR